MKRKKIIEIIKNLVKCETCKCYLNKKDAKEIETNYICGSLFYCQKCKPKYNKIKLEFVDIGADFKKVYLKDNVECDKNGKIIK